MKSREFSLLLPHLLHLVLQLIEAPDDLLHSHDRKVLEAWEFVGKCLEGLTESLPVWQWLGWLGHVVACGRDGYRTPTRLYSSNDHNRYQR